MEFNNQYLTYLDYKVLGGELPEMPFNKLEFKARKEINKATLNRLVKLTNQKQEVKLCMYELINTLFHEEKIKNETKGIASESYPGYSVNYSNTNESSIKTEQVEHRNIITTYLSNCYLDDGTAYLYPGVDSL